jgi:hypothetical protein
VVSETQLAELKQLCAERAWTIKNLREELHTAQADRTREVRKLRKQLEETQEMLRELETENTRLRSTKG